MRRIAILTTSYPAHAGDASGHFVAAEAEELARAGHSVHVLCPGEGPEGERNDVRIQPCGGLDAFGWPGAIARLRERPWRVVGATHFVARARSVLRSMASDIDAVHAHWMVPSAWPIARIVDRPVRVTCHGGDVRSLCALPRASRQHIVGDVTRRSQRIAFASRALRSELCRSLDDALAAALEAKSVVEAPMLIVGVPDARLRESRRHLLCPDPNVLLVAVVGRLVEGKRVDLALRAAAAVRTPVRLVIIGDGPARPRLEHLAAELGVDARFEGRCDRELTHELLAACDVLLHTSAAEGAPSVVREARVLGVRVVATSSGDLAVWAARDPGIVVVNESPAALADRIAET